jgi:SAM-dependent methyltransferase
MSSFDEISLIYDSAIDWDSRLKREIPFLKRCLSEVEGSSILDVACGTGHHATSLAKAGAKVVGFDGSQSMIERAKELASQEAIDVDFHFGLMEDNEQYTPDSYDLIYCLGNSMALLQDMNSVNTFLSRVLNSLKIGGSFVCQVLNFEEVLNKNYRFMPIKSGKTSDGREVVFVRFFDHLVDKQHSILVLTAFIKDDGKWISDTTFQNVLRLDMNLVYSSFREAGFRNINVFADYQGNGFIESQHRDMIFKARKG